MMKRVYGLIIFAIAQYILSNNVLAQVWQWSVSVDSLISSETNDHPQAFLWIPSDCRQVRAVIVGQHNMSEEDLFENALFRKRMEELDFALVWITPGLDMQWDIRKGTQSHFDRMMNSLAEQSGYTELKYAPIIPAGHSAHATYPWNFAAWNPERTLAILSLHGDAPRTNLTGYGGENLEWGRTRNIDGIPGLMMEGEYEWWEDRVTPALAFRMMYPKSCVSFYCDAGQGHFDVSDKLVSYIFLFLKKAAAYRLPKEMPVDRPAELISVNPAQGWLAERWHPNQIKRPNPAPYGQYKGDPHDAFWYFDEETATETEKRYAAHRRKKEQYIGFVQDNRLLTFDPNLHARIKGAFHPEADGLTFHVKAAFTDTLRTTFSDKHAQTPLYIKRICGPVKKINDTTFHVNFYRMGMHNTRRTGEIWLVAENQGDKQYNSSVQQLVIQIPYRNTEGKQQFILFPGLENVKAGATAPVLRAVADSELPVNYYVKEGPAEIKENKLIFTSIPPKAKFPVKVSVVAWQYGIKGKVQTAEPVERSFYILSK